MKKSLFIILSIFLTSLSVHAVGVDCWEEYTRDFNPSTVSKMKDVLGDDVVITRVKSGIKIGKYYIRSTDNGRAEGLSEAIFPIDTYASYTNKSKTYYPRFGYFYYDGSSVAYMKDYKAYTEDNSDYLGSYTFYVLGRSDYNKIDLDDAFALYVHTYCIVSDHSSSGGGGGGSAGAAVNYIIKAD